MAKKVNTKTEKKKVDIIDMSNKPINSDVQNKKVEINAKMVKVISKKPKIAESKIKLNNGRVYKDLGNGYGMYADNGQVFRI